MKMDDVLDAVERWLAEGRSVALGTVVDTWGSAPRPPGSQIAVRDDGTFAGSVSGGCVEGAVIDAAHATMADGKLRHLEFGVLDEQAWSVGLACGGRIEIFVEPIGSPQSRDTLRILNEARHQERAIVRAIDLATGEDRLVDPNLDPSPLGMAAASASRTDRCAAAEVEGRTWFLTVYNPPVDIVIVGAVQVAQALVKMAALLGCRVRVIDPRTSFATKERFPDVALSHEYPDEALTRMPLGRRSALVALSHDPKIDDPALVAALQSPAFYIAALGSKKTHAARIKRLRARGFSDVMLARVHGPAGLAIGAKSPEEIALSIAAQMTERLRSGAQS
jgi:xanthine dehydrogenase accessory factor